MSNFQIQFDPRRCIACKACEVHCQSAHQTQPDVKMGLLIATEPVCEDGAIRILSAFRACFHCEAPWCMAACPTGAIKKREQDGVVYVEAQLCIGCKACVDACPWQVPQWDAAGGKVQKCDYCRSRIDDGELPACVAACTTHALTFKGPNTGTRKTRQDYVKSVIEQKRWL